MWVNEFSLLRLRIPVEAVTVQIFRLVLIEQKDQKTLFTQVELKRKHMLGKSFPRKSED